jgi:hypothetical protein
MAHLGAPFDMDDRGGQAGIDARKSINAICSLSIASARIRYRYSFLSYIYPAQAPLYHQSLPTMACLIAAGVVYTVKGVQSGIQAHKDSKSDQPIAPPTDRYGNPKERHPVYGLVMKAKGKGKGKTIAASEAGANARSGTGLGIDAPAERRLNKEEYESENYGGQSYAAKRQVVSPDTMPYDLNHGLTGRNPRRHHMKLRSVRLRPATWVHQPRAPMSLELHPSRLALRVP